MEVGSSGENWKTWNGHLKLRLPIEIHRKQNKILHKQIILQFSIYNICLVWYLEYLQTIFEEILFCIKFGHTFGHLSLTLGQKPRTTDISHQGKILKIFLPKGPNLCSIAWLYKSNVLCAFWDICYGHWSLSYLGSWYRLILGVFWVIMDAGERKYKTIIGIVRKRLWKRFKVNVGVIYGVRNDIWGRVLGGS